ncbi:MAG: hypothetical protein WBA51_06690 [Erythrobacter sp.]
MQYPNRIQACLLLDTSFSGLDDVANDVARIIQMKTGETFNTPEHKPGTFLRLFGGGEDLMLTFEYVPSPPAADVFAGTLASAITGILSPSMGQRVARARSHILIEVSHGALGGVDEDPRFAAMFSELGVAQAWSTQEAFHKRLETLALMTRVAIDHITPSAIHWTQSNQLLEPEKFEIMAGPAGAMEFPSPLTIRPILFSEERASGEAKPGEPVKVGLRTLGARHWLGREILIPATTLPWAAAYQTALTFCRIATMKNGYVIPDGDTFGHEGDDTGAESSGAGEVWRVHHRDAAWAYDQATTNGDSDGSDQTSAADPVPLYELVPLRHDACEFVSEDYVSRARITKSRGQEMPGESEFDPVNLPVDAATIIAEKRRMAEAIGGRVEVRAMAESADAQPENEAFNEVSFPGDVASEDANLGQAASEGAATNIAPISPPAPTNPAQSNPGEVSVSGRSLRAKVFGRKGV